MYEYVMRCILFKFYVTYKCTDMSGFVFFYVTSIQIIINNNLGIYITHKSSLAGSWPSCIFFSEIAQTWKRASKYCSCSLRTVCLSNETLEAALQCISSKCHTQINVLTVLSLLTTGHFTFKCMHWICQYLYSAMY